MLAAKRHSDFEIRSLSKESLDSTVSRWIRSSFRENVHFYSYPRYKPLHMRRSDRAPKPPLSADADTPGVPRLFFLPAYPNGSINTRWNA